MVHCMIKSLFIARYKQFGVDEHYADGGNKAYQVDKGIGDLRCFNRRFPLRNRDV